MTSSKRHFAISLGVLVAVACLAAVPLLAFAASSPDLLNAPKLQIPIPGLDLAAEMQKTGGDAISVYVAGVYRFLISIIGVVAGVMIMVGGFTYLTAGGDKSKVDEGKKRIYNALVGIVLAFSSYLLLYTLNPDLVNFKSFKIIAIAPISYDFYDDFDPETPDGAVTSPSAFSATQLDDIFKKYAPCAGVDWRALKAIAYKESGLNTNLTNKSGYVGLFQTKPGNCRGALSGYQLASQCDDLTNPEVNTAVGAMMLKKAVSIIQNRCPGASLQDQFTMLYVNHNMGSGVLVHAVNFGCDEASLRQGVIDYYSTDSRGQTTAKNYSTKYQASCLASNSNNYAECTGGPKFDFAQKTAQTMGGLGVTTLTVPSDSSSCPLK